MKIGLVCALNEEIQLLQDTLLCVYKHTRGSVTVIEADNFPHTLYLTISGIGKTNAAIATHTLIANFDCELIINTGLAGGCDPRIAPGAVVLITKALYHDFDVGPLHEVERLTEGFFADEGLLNRAKSIIESQGIDCIEGIVASGDAFICDSKIKADIVSRTGCICVDMEAAAIAHVASKNNIPYISLKVISDQADETAKEDFDMSLNLYTEYCSDFIRKMLESL